MRRAHSRRSERGYAMVALLVLMSVMAIVLSTAMPVYQTVARREREAELVFRGEQYARAIAMFQRKYGNALPPSVDVLIEQRFLRKKYKDPITGDDFQYMGAGSPELAQAMATTPQQTQDAQRGRGAGGQVTNQGGRVQSTPFGASQSGRGAPFGSNQGTRGAAAARGPMTAAGRAGDAQAGGGLLAVASKSTEKSMRLYNGKDKYNEWIFMAVAATTAAGAPPGTGGQAPGGRGGRAGGRGGVPQGGRSGTPPTGGQGTSPFSSPRGGFSPVARP